jgi:hypothetical protein
MREYEFVLQHRTLGMTPVLLMSGGPRPGKWETSSLLRVGTLRLFERFAL